jgi:hypothetical protein
MSRKAWLAVVLLLPVVAAAAPQGAPPEAGRDRGRRERVQKRLRVARAVGLAEALDLDATAALRLRDVLARYDERRAPLREQLRGAVQIVRDAARGDGAAAAQVDPALQRARDARAKLQQLDAQMLDELAKGLPPEKKARAALFLATFHHRAAHVAMHRGGRGGGHGPERRPGPRTGERGVLDEGRAGVPGLEGFTWNGRFDGPDDGAIEAAFERE